MDKIHNIDTMIFSIIIMNFQIERLAEKELEVQKNIVKWIPNDKLVKDYENLSKSIDTIYHFKNKMREHSEKLRSYYENYNNLIKKEVVLSSVYISTTNLISFKEISFHSLKLVF